MIIAVDFDGTLCTDCYPELGAPAVGAVSVMQELHEAGHYLIIWTCRTGELLKDAINWLLEHGIPFDRVNDHNPENVAQYGEGGNKVYADVYIDDRNLGGFPGWFDVMPLLEQGKRTQERRQS